MSTETLTYATEANPELQRHHWQGLAGLVCDHRPEWPVSEVIESLWLCRNKQTFPQLAQTALAIAMDPKYKTPAAIHMSAMGMFDGDREYIDPLELGFAFVAVEELAKTIMASGQISIDQWNAAMAAGAAWKEQAGK